MKKDKRKPEIGKKTLKVRIIVDAKQSATTSVARRTHKSNLPTASTAAKGFLGLMHHPEYKPGVCDIELLIADVSDAFWLILLRRCEQRYFVIKYRGEYLVFVRTAQGSRGAPLSWAAVAAVLARLVQSLFALPDGNQSARLQM